MGQPDAEDLHALARAGVRRVVNLRPHSELNWDEAACAAQCGLEYVNIPVASPDDLNRANADRLQQAIAGDAPVLVHCGSSNRVGALLALLAVWQWGKSHEEALALGRAAGLTAMEPAVRMRLAQPV